MQIHHIGYLIKNIEKARDSFTVLGFSTGQDIVYDSQRDIDILFMKNAEGINIELITPKSEHSVVAKLFKTYKNAPYHLCYLSDDLDHDIVQLGEAGFIQIDAPTPAPALENRRVCFLMAPHAGLIELLENRPRIRL